MKAKINIVIWDDTPQEVFDAAGITNDYLKNLYEFTFKEILEDSVVDRCNYELDVEITDEVN